MQNQIKSFQWTEPTWSIFILFFWVGFSAIYTVLGKGKILAGLVSVYIARLLMLQMGGLKTFVLKHVPANSASFVDLGIFVLIFLILFTCFTRLVFRTMVDNRSIKTIVFAGIFAFLQIGFLINSTLAFVPKGLVDKLDPLIKSLFVGQYQNIFWLIAPLVVLIVLGSKLSDEENS